jgi:hypothetical protein
MISLSCLLYLTAKKKRFFYQLFKSPENLNLKHVFVIIVHIQNNLYMYLLLWFISRTIYTYICYYGSYPEQSIHIFVIMVHIQNNLYMYLLLWFISRTIYTCIWFAYYWSCIFLKKKSFLFIFLPLMLKEYDLHCSSSGLLGYLIKTKNMYDRLRSTSRL